MDVYQKMLTIKQECIENEVHYEEVDIKLIKEEPCSIETETVQEDIDALNISYTEDILPKVDFIKCEEETVFDWDADKVEHYALAQDQLMNIKKETSSDILRDYNEEVAITDNNTGAGSVSQEDTLQNMPCKSIAGDNQEPSSTKVTSVDTNMDGGNGTQQKCPQSRRYSTPKKRLNKAHSNSLFDININKCTHCTYCTTVKSNLVKHMKTHSGEKPYKCPHCSYSATEKSSLISHNMRNHPGEKPYKCSLCSYSATLKSNLVVHMRIHSGEKPYKCPQCSYSAAQKSTLKTHMRIHSGEKPYKCPQCSYSAAQQSTWKNHIMKIHSGEKPYKFCSTKLYTRNTYENSFGQRTI